METIAFWLVFVFFISLNILFLLIKIKTIETIVIHLIIMLSSLVIGTLQMFEYDATITILFLFIVIVSFIGDVLMIEIKEV